MMPPGLCKSSQKYLKFEEASDQRSAVSVQFFAGRRVVVNIALRSVAVFCSQPKGTKPTVSFPWSLYIFEIRREDFSGLSPRIPVT
jgi:hypothetical protein